MELSIARFEHFKSHLVKMFKALKLRSSSHDLLDLHATDVVSYLVSSVGVLVGVVFFGQFAVGLEWRGERK